MAGAKMERESVRLSSNLYTTLKSPTMENHQRFLKQSGYMFKYIFVYFLENWNGSFMEDEQETRDMELEIVGIIKVKVNWMVGM
jgi:hypothetical protein